MQGDSAVFHDAGDRFFVGIGHIFFNVGRPVLGHRIHPFVRMDLGSAKNPGPLSGCGFGAKQILLARPNVCVCFWHKAD